MSLETWIAFLIASAAMLAIPGPTILLVIGQSLGAGRGRALPLVAGVALGDLTAMTLSLAGRLSGAVARPTVRRGVNRLGGGVLIGAGLATAAMRRA